MSSCFYTLYSCLQLTFIHPDLTDVFKAGVLKAPGKLVVLKDGTVEQSPADNKKYRALTLPNGLRVSLLVQPKKLCYASLFVCLFALSIPA